MRVSSRWAPLGLLLVAAFFVSACASGGGAPGDAAAAPGETVLRVHNTDQRGEALRIFIVPDAGQAQFLGSVAADDYLTVPHPGGQGRFQFRAERQDGSMFSSPMFTVVSGTYTWDIALRRVDRSR